jgi:flagellar biosynthesis/type III secretory pathway protein FliH
MNLVARNSPVRIALHPAQRALLLDSLTQLQQEYTTLRDAELLDDDSIAPGGCRVFTPHGRIDADLDAQLDRIAR